jgi:hypothetical protein
MSATVGIWANLPTELVIYVLQQTQDIADAWRWCEATIGNNVLHQAAISHAFYYTYFCADDLFLAPEELADQGWQSREGILGSADSGSDSESDGDPDEIKNIPGSGPARRATLEHLKKNCLNTSSKLNQLLKLDHNIRAAQYVHHLTLDLNLETIEINGEYCQPSIRSLEHSLGIFFPHLQRVKTITFDGPIGKEVVSAILKSPSSTLESLSFRITYTNYRYLHGNVSPPPGIEALKWTELAPIQSLRTLIINEFIAEESIELVNLVKQLKALSNLEIVARWSEDADPPSANSVNPMRRLLGSQNWKDQQRTPNLLANLPSSLKILQLVDNHHLGNQAPTIEKGPSWIEATDTPILEELVTELDKPDSTYNILSWLPNSKLRRLVLSPSPAAATYSWPRDIKTGSLLKDTLSLVNELVTAQQGTLGQLVLKNMWNIHLDFVDKFNDHWLSRYKITDVIIGTVCHVGTLAVPSKVKLRDLFCHMPLASWRRLGSDIERIRIEHGLMARDLHASATKCRLGFNRFHALRILIVSPRTYMNDESTNPEAQDKSDTDLAQELSSTSYPCFRYIAIRRTAFWVDRKNRAQDLIDNLDSDSIDDKHKTQWSTSEFDGSSFRLVDWKHAVSGLDKRVKKEIDEWICPADLDIIDSQSPLNRERRGLPEDADDPGYPYVQKWNFFVAHRTRKEPGIQG